MPYTYHICWSLHNIHYYGVKFSKNCDPKNLWVTYFTSSKHVKKFIEINGQPDIIEIRKTFIDKLDALAWESRVLRKLHVSTNSSYLNKSYGLGHMIADVTGIKQTADHVKKRTSQRIGVKQTDKCKKLISEKAKGMTTVIDLNGNKFKVSTSDPRLISGELVGHTVGYFCAVNAQGVKFWIRKTDDRYLSGEIWAQSKGRPHNKKI